MKVIKALSLASAALMTALCAGCDNKSAPVPIPEVNDENCQPDNMAKADVSVRQQLADACARRGSFKPGKPDAGNPATATMPEVNDENCKPENVAKADASVRQPFADACARRGSFKPSAGKTY